MTHTPERVLEALHEGRITAREADVFLQRVHGVKLDELQPLPAMEQPLVVKPSHWHAYLVILAMVGLVATGLVFQGELTGLIVYEVPEGNLSETSIPITQAVTRLSASGTMYGDGTAVLVFEANGTNYTVASLASDTGAPRTERASYVPGEPVTLENAPNASVYLDDGLATEAVTPPFPAPAVGRYELLVITNDSGSLESTRIPLIVSETPVERETTFSGECGQACSLPGLTGVLHILPEGTTVDLDLDVAFAGENRAPVLEEPFDDLAIQGNITIDLSGHFTDPEGEPLLYSTSLGEHVTPIVRGSTLTLVPVSTGSEEFTVYASDLEHLSQASFTVSVTTSGQQDATNETVRNDTLVTVPDTNASGAAPDCSHPNPNLRPVECLQEQADEYFAQDIHWENRDLVRVAKLNALGNLLIRGIVMEYSTSAPGPRDFVVGSVDRDGSTQPAIWIDGDGNLHLRGRLYEEEINLAPAPGSYSVMTARSVYLAYVDYGSGDLHLRGNVIPYRRSVE